MIDMDKYDGASKVYITEHMWHGFTEVEEARSGKVLARIYAGDTVKEAKPTPAHYILLDAFVLHREVVRLRGLLESVIENAAEPSGDDGTGYRYCEVDAELVEMIKEEWRRKE